MVQPWLGLVASFGSPRFRERHLLSCYASQAQWWRGNTTVDAARPLQRAITRLGWRSAMRLQNVQECGPTPVGGRAMVTSAAAGDRFGSLRLVANHTTAERRRGTFRAGGHRVSPTSNLIRVRKRPQEWPAARRGGRRLHRAANDCDRTLPLDQQPRSRCSWAGRGGGGGVQPRAVGSNGTAAAAAAAAGVGMRRVHGLSPAWGRGEGRGEVGDRSSGGGAPRPRACAALLGVWAALAISGNLGSSRVVSGYGPPLQSRVISGSLGVCAAPATSGYCRVISDSLGVWAAPAGLDSDTSWSPPAPTPRSSHRHTHAPRAQIARAPSREGQTGRDRLGGQASAESHAPPRP